LSEYIIILSVQTSLSRKSYAAGVAMGGGVALEVLRNCTLQIDIFLPHLHTYWMRRLTAFSVFNYTASTRWGLSYFLMLCCSAYIS